MKPLQLKMTAFGSYIQPTTLDFEKNLHGEKIFLIHGATGAGKTTILDAICYALYGESSGDERDGAMMRSKGISDDVITRVEFRFLLGEKIYTVRRELTFHPNRKTNQFQTTAELTCNGKHLESKTVAVTNKIKELIGFASEQFRQVVLLPQGEFKNFLSAKADERQPVLDALFNAEFYKRVEDGLKIKSDAAQKVFDDLNREKETLTVQFQDFKTDDAALEKLRADYSAAQEKSALLKKFLDKAHEEHTAGEKLADNFAELERRNNSLDAAKNNLEQAEKIFSAAKIEYDLREGEQSKREELKSQVDELAKTKKSLVELEEKRKALDEADKKLKAATDTLEKLEGNAKKFEARLAELKARRNELSGAEKNFAEAQTASKRADEREKVLKEIAQLERESAATRQQIISAEKFFNNADIECKRLEKLQRDGSAARLAKNLRDGEPCPVCGSRTHFNVDFSNAIVPSDKEIEDSQAEVDRRKKILDDKKNFAASIEGQLISKRDELKKFSDVPAYEDVQKKFAAAKKDAEEFADCEKRIAKGERCIEENKSALDAAREKKVDASNERGKIIGAIQTLQAQIDEKYLVNSQQLDAELAETQKKFQELDSAWKVADKTFRDAEKRKSLCEGAFSTAQKAQAELAEKLANEKPPEIDELKNRLQEAQRNHEAAVREETSLKNNLDKLKNLSVKLAELDKKISVAEKNLLVWKKLSDVASGKIAGKKISFVRYYLSAMFEQVLTEANYRLEKMSNRRYSLKSKYAGKRENSKAGLNLEILDDYTGENRPVATLSGGESFLASLALALGLAAVVRNSLGGIKLDTIFIDEGFGSLDSEALDDAISAIIEQSSGRLVGIISHVEELKNQIPVRLEVKTNKTGSTAEFKYGFSRD